MSKFTKTIAGIVSGLALVATVAGVASAATFTNNLTIGSTGPDVVALQTWLVAKGYLVMPTGVSYGYFGNLTQAAVAAYQTAKGITPAVGYFGPVTMAAVNADAAMTTGGTSMVPGCAAGAMYSSTTGAACTTTSTVAGCVAGAMYSSTTGAPCSSTTTSTGGTVSTAGFTQDGSDGSIVASYSPYVTSSQTLDAGNTKDVYAVQVQATSGKVDINRFDVHFTERPWLDFTQVQLHDTNGTVIATKTLASSADATEITVGSDYLVRFDGFNYVVTPGTIETLVVSVTVAPSSSHIVGQQVGVSVPDGSIRTINGLGYTDSLGLGSVPTLGTPATINGVSAATVNASGTSADVITLSQSGSVAAIYTRISPNTPDTRIVTTSVNQTTPSVVLGVFSLESQNQNATINSLNFNIADSPNSVGNPTTLFQNLRLQVNGATYGANSFTASTTQPLTTAGATFSNLAVNLPEDQWTDVTLLADVDQNVSGVSASSTMVASGINGVDANYNTLNVTSASNATSNVTQLQTAGISISNMSASYSLTTGGTNGNTVGAAVTFAFTVTNTGNNDVFISKVPSIALGTSTAGSVGSPVAASSTITYVTSNPSNFAADTGTAPTSGAFDVPAGSSRTLTYSGSLDNTNGTAGIRVFKITAINFGTSASAPTGSTINFNLDPLTVTPSLSAN